MILLDEVNAKIKEIEDDDRYKSFLDKPATIDINAPLALIQMGMASEMKVLNWVRVRLSKDGGLLGNRCWNTTCRDWEDHGPHQCKFDTRINGNLCNKVVWIVPELY